MTAGTDLIRVSGQALQHPLTLCNSLCGILHTNSRLQEVQVEVLWEDSGLEQKIHCRGRHLGHTQCLQRLKHTKTPAIHSHLLTVKHWAGCLSRIPPLPLGCWHAPSPGHSPRWHSAALAAEGPLAIQECPCQHSVACCGQAEPCEQSQQSAGCKPRLELCHLAADKTMCAL